MEIRLCATKEVWESSPAVQTDEFLQSYEWGEFQDFVGHEPARVQVYDGDVVMWQGQGFVHKLPLGLKYIYFPRVIDLRFQICDFRLFCKKELGFFPVFIRVEPISQLKISNLNSKITTCRQPKRTLVLDLNRSEEELLGGMHHKTRYNIRVAQKHGVEIKTEKNADIFWKLNNETTARDKFKSHNREYYEKMLSCPLTHQYTAWYEGVPIASHIYVVYGSVWTYLHGTSGNQYRNVMAPYLLHWQSILQAKELGCKKYDFWGIAPEAENGEVNSEYNGISWQGDHRWTGITRYKAGFGGEVKKYQDAYEVPLRPWLYKIMSLIKKFL